MTAQRARTKEASRGQSRTSPPSPWSTERIGPTAYVHVRSIDPAIIAEMPESTRKFTDVGAIELIMLRLKSFQRAIMGNTRRKSGNNSNPD